MLIKPTQIIIKFNCPLCGKESVTNHTPEEIYIDYDVCHNDISHEKMDVIIDVQCSECHKNSKLKIN